MELHPEFPRELMQVAWLDLDSDAGQEYWHAMELMGRYAAANHLLIHRAVAKLLGASVLLCLSPSALKGADMMIKARNESLAKSPVL